MSIPVEPVRAGRSASVSRDPEAMRAALAAAVPEAAANPASVRIVRAPGRVNLIGEHTDYNEGFVLPMAIDLGLTIALLPTDDRRVELTLLDGGERRGLQLPEIALASPAPAHRRGGWLDYVAGTAWSLARAGVAVRGFRGVLAADLPQAAGLSSSAALELASAWALSGGESPPLPPMALALACQRAENQYVGVQTGLMDQFAVTFGEPAAALLLDCRSYAHRTVPVPPDMAVVVCDSRVSRRLVASDYDARREECERAVRAFAAVDPAIRSLRDVTPRFLGEHATVPDPVAFRRARHVVTENRRVGDAVAAMESGDVAALGRLLVESHRSLRLDFEVSTPELDLLVETALGVDGVYGARMTGAGLGGCTVNLVRPDAVGALREAVMAVYPQRTGLTPWLSEVLPSAGVGPLTPAGTVDRTRGVAQDGS